MIHGPERFNLPTANGHRVDVLVNWNTYSQNCEFLRMRVDGGCDILIPRSAFIRAAMFIANEEEQDALIPTQTVKVRKLKKEYTVRLLRDMEKGETLTIPVSFEVPLPSGYDELPVIEESNNYS